MDKDTEFGVQNEDFLAMYGFSKLNTWGDPQPLVFCKVCGLVFYAHWEFIGKHHEGHINGN